RGGGGGVRCPRRRGRLRRRRVRAARRLGGRGGAGVRGGGGGDGAALPLRPGGVWAGRRGARRGVRAARRRGPGPRGRQRPVLAVTARVGAAGRSLRARPVVAAAPAPRLR